MVTWLLWYGCKILLHLFHVFVLSSTPFYDILCMLLSNEFRGQSHGCFHVRPVTKCIRAISRSFLTYFWGCVLISLGMILIWPAFLSTCKFCHHACCRVLLLQAWSPATLSVAEYCIQWAMAGMGSGRDQVHRRRVQHFRQQCRTNASSLWPTQSAHYILCEG